MFSHFTVITEGVAHNLDRHFDCRNGRVFMSVNLWVETEEQIFDMVSEIGRDAGCDVRGDLRVYKTEPKQAAQNDAYGYGINFAPYGD